MLTAWNHKLLICQHSHYYYYHTFTITIKVIYIHIKTDSSDQFCRILILVYHIWIVSLFRLLSIILHLKCGKHIVEGWRRFASIHYNCARRMTHICVFNMWLVCMHYTLLNTTPQGGMFPEVLHPPALLGSLVSISWKFQFSKIDSEFVINF